ncbi:MAG: O-acetyl-ADP-ribose deacetylase [Candidatus Marinimicrobia bacterium]|nr:O-acetyl-ADP-ribose deacetylase [Candidatus Neomarinimicrobiota bacterium]
MTKTIYRNVTIELRRGDIVNQPDCDAVVNAANAQLRIGGGVAGAIHRAAGPELEKETRPLAPIEPGEAVITGGHGLPNPHIIHCLGPVYGRDEPSDTLLADCYRNALQRAEENELKVIGFPAISTGAFGYPMEDAAQIAMSTMKEVIPDLRHVSTIRFVLWGKQAMDVHEKVLNTVFQD